VTDTQLHSLNKYLCEYNTCIKEKRQCVDLDLGGLHVSVHPLHYRFVYQKL
jgi:hypothetical protein